MKHLLSLILLAFALVSCDTGDEVEYQGGLYFAQGAYLMRYSLRDGSLAVAGHLGDTQIRELSALGPDELLIAESASVNRRRVPRITWFDPRTGETADLYAGMYARHLPDPGVVVYDDGSDLFAVPQLNASESRVIFSHPQNRLTRLVAAGPGTLLFEAGDSGRPTIHAWDAASGHMRELFELAEICRLDGAVWVDSLDRLACKQRNGPVLEAGYLFADLDGNVHGSLDLPAGKQFMAMTYIPGQDVLVLQETWRGMLGERDRHAIWMHHLDTGASTRLADNMSLGDSAVYAEY